MKNQVATAMQQGMLELIRCNRKYLSLESCQKLASRLTSWLFKIMVTHFIFNLPYRELNRHYRLQNYTAKAILGRNRKDTNKGKDKD